MIRLLTLSSGLLLCTGCLSLDFLVFSNPSVDEYEVDEDLIDPDILEFVTFETPDGKTLHGVWARQPAAAPPLIYFHGNAGHIGDNWDRIAYYTTWGYDVFAVDYRGFGRSEGPADFQGVFETDGTATAEYVSAESGYALEDIPWASLSMGAGVAAHTNDETPAQAVILESMFASTDALADDGTGQDLPMGWFFNDDYDNVAAVAKMTSPVFVIHGEQDDYIDGAYGPVVYEAAPEPKEFWFPPDVDHTNAPEVRGDEFRDLARAFFAAHGDVPPLPED